MESKPKEVAIKTLPSLVAKEYEEAIQMNTYTPEDFLQSISEKFLRPKNHIKGPWSSFPLIPEILPRFSRYFSLSGSMVHALERNFYHFPFQFGIEEIQALGALFCNLKYAPDRQIEHKIGC